MVKKPIKTDKGKNQAPLPALKALKPFNQLISAVICDRISLALSTGGQDANDTEASRYCKGQAVCD